MYSCENKDNGWKFVSSALLHFGSTHPQRGNLNLAISILRSAKLRPITCGIAKCNVQNWVYKIFDCILLPGKLKLTTSTVALYNRKLFEACRFFDPTFDRQMQSPFYECILQSHFASCTVVTSAKEGHVVARGWSFPERITSWESSKSHDHSRSPFCIPFRISHRSYESWEWLYQFGKVEMTLLGQFTTNFNRNIL